MAMSESYHPEQKPSTGQTLRQYSKGQSHGRIVIEHAGSSWLPSLVHTKQGHCWRIWPHCRLVWVRGAALETGVQGLTFSVAGMRKTDIFVARSKTVNLGSSMFLNSSWLQWAMGSIPRHAVLLVCKGPRASFMTFRGRAPWAQNTGLLNTKLGRQNIKRARERV